MPSPTEISVAQLSRIIGLPGAPVLVDVRPCDDGGSGQRLLPTARHMEFQTVSTWAHNFSGQRIIVYCGNGGEVSQGTAPGFGKQASMPRHLKAGSKHGAKPANLSCVWTDFRNATKAAGRLGSREHDRRSFGLLAPG
jgi:hypothetical protein